jgi:hypothetical protein
LRKSSTLLAAVALLGLATACTSGNSGLSPAYTSATLSNDRLVFAVGVATFEDGSQGLNVVTSWRQPNGLSATGLSTPTITGPTGFVVPPSAQAGTDAGTNVISGSLEVLPGQKTRASTFSTNNGVFAYGIEPDNSTTSGAFATAMNTLPFYAGDQDPNCTIYPPNPDCPQDQFIGGPPAFPNFKDGSYPVGFVGYSEGFTDFYAAPVAGTYTEKLTIQTSNSGTYVTPVLSGTITNTAGLPVWTTTPTLTPDVSNGATITFVPPAGVTETIVNVIDQNTGGFFTAVATGGATSVSIPGNIGPGDPVTPTFNDGDPLVVQMIGVDYPAFEAAPPDNTKIAPVLAGPNGQADVTTFDYTGTYGGVLTPESKSRSMRAKFGRPLNSKTK